MSSYFAFYGMLSKSAVTAAARIGSVNQRAAFSVSKVKSSDEISAIGLVETKTDHINLEAVKPGNYTQEMKDLYFPQIGNRDIVGPSFGVQFDYFDTADYPMPAVRFAANTPAVVALHQKQQGDWGSLTLEEKKQLYRNSYRQTFAEFQAHTGEWMRVSSLTLYTFALATVIFVYNAVTYGTTPETYTKDYQQEVIATMLLRNIGRYSGISSKYDFEKNEWKK